METTDVTECLIKTGRAFIDGGLQIQKRILILTVITLYFATIYMYTGPEMISILYD